MTKIPPQIRKMANNRDLQVSVRIGRNGVTDSLVEEIESQLAKSELVKVKANRGVVEGSSERENLFDQIALLSNSILVTLRGNVAVFWRSK